MSDLLCRFVAVGDGIHCRCAHAGCTNRVRAADPAVCRARCRATARDLLKSPCCHLGEATGASFRCRGCPGSPRVHALFACAVHGSCLPWARVREAQCCATCKDYRPLLDRADGNTPEA
jgi:hypothetical protein